MATDSVPSAPALSVIVPLVDGRDVTFESIEGWTRQTVPAGRLEIVAVSNGERPELDAGVRRLLRRFDRLIHHRSHNEIALYAAGAQAAAADLLLLTESHCLPEPDTAEEVLRFFASSPCAAASLGSTNIALTEIARLEGRLFDEGLRSRPEPGWRDVSLRGFAVRKAAYLAAGGFDEAYGRFGEAPLAVELERLGHRLGRLPEAVVHHRNCATFRELAPALRAHARGQAAYRERCEARLAPEILEPLADWSGRAALAPSVARRLAAVVLRSLSLDRSRPGWRARSLVGLRSLPALAASSLSGPRWAHAAARLAAWRAMGRCLLSRGKEEERLWADYIMAWTALLRWGAMDYIAEERSALAGPLAAPPLVRPGELPDGALVGFHRPELWGQESCRWSRPLALVRLRLPRGDYRVALDVRSPVPVERRCPRLFFNRHPIADEALRETGGRLAFNLRPDMFDPGDEQGLALVVSPFRPRLSGLQDDRELGLAVFSIAVEPL